MPSVAAVTSYLRSCEASKAGYSKMASSVRALPFCAHFTRTVGRCNGTELLLRNLSDTIVLSSIAHDEPLVETWNELWRRAHHFDYIFIANCDDEFKPEFAKLIDTLEDSPDAVVAYGDFLMTYPDEPGRKPDIIHQPQPNKPIWQTPIPGPFAVFRTSAAQAVELEPGVLWDPDYPVCADHHLWIRLATQGRFIRVPEVVGVFANRKDSVSHRNRAETNLERARLKAWGREYLERNVMEPTSLTVSCA